jgi:hypothetical protein
VVAAAEEEVSPRYTPKDAFGCKHSGICLDKMKTFDTTGVKAYLKKDMWLEGKHCVLCKIKIETLLANHQAKETAFKLLSAEDKEQEVRPAPFKLQYCDKGCGAHNCEDDDDYNKCDHVCCPSCLIAKMKAYHEEKDAGEGVGPTSRASRRG